MTSITVTFDDRGLAPRYARSPETIQRELVALVDRLAKRGVQTGQQRVRKDTRRLHDSLRVERARPIGRRVVGGWGAHDVPGKVLANEFGRRAGAAMPPRGALLGWMSRRGIPPEREFVIRRGIARKGIRPQPFLEPGADDVRRMVPLEIALTASRIVAQLGAP